MTTADTTTRTRIGDSTGDYVPIEVEGATRDLAVVFNSEWTAPRVVVLKENHEAEWFDLTPVTVGNHPWLTDDGIDGDERMTIAAGSLTDEVHIRGVAENMVGVDYAEYIEETPRLLIFPEHTHDDETPTSVPL